MNIDDGVIRQLRADEPIRKREIEITEFERSDLLLVAEKDRMKRLEELRARPHRSKGSRKRARGGTKP